MPFIPNPETFLSLALCGSIRDGIVPWPTLADYLLYHLNKYNPALYTIAYNMEEPSNDLMQFLVAVATRTGRLGRGGVVDEVIASIEAVWHFRKGKLGTWPIDRITQDAFDLRIKEELLSRKKEIHFNPAPENSNKGKGISPLQYVLTLIEKPRGVLAKRKQNINTKTRKRIGTTRSSRAMGSRNTGGRKAVNRNKGKKK